MKLAERQQKTEQNDTKYLLKLILKIKKIVLFNEWNVSPTPSDNWVFVIHLFVNTVL